jgi:hypothetical protein
MMCAKGNNDVKKGENDVYKGNNDAHLCLYKKENCNHQLCTIFCNLFIVSKCTCGWWGACQCLFVQEQ